MKDIDNRLRLNRGGYVLTEFKGNRRELFRNPYEFPFRSGDLVIVEADRGQDAGMVRHVIAGLGVAGQAQPQFAVIKRAALADQERLKRLREYEKQAIAVCQKRVAVHRLAMKLVDAEYRFDGLKLTFFFTAEGRVDFRELVRDLASTFRTRIELRQIGARDETKRGDGYGLCGQRLCCVGFLNVFQPITTQMAKTQNLILNPSKLSGLCGRLKCCLAYEFSDYTPQEGEVPAVAEVIDEGLEQLSD